MTEWKEVSEAEFYMLRWLKGWIAAEEIRALERYRIACSLV